MTQLKRFSPFFLKLFLLFLLPAVVCANEMVMVEPTRIVVNNPQAKQAIQLQKVTLKSTITGSVAKTRIELVLYNPNALQLEGELQFPLLSNQTVSGFALDINGEMRPAVAVEKAVGQQVFEDITRQKVDPALLEKTSGQFYKLRVYPLPAQGTRTVQLEISQNLTIPSQGTVAYQFPLMFAQSIGKLDMQTTILGVAPDQVKATLGATALKTSKNGKDTLVQLNQNTFNNSKALLNIELPRVINTSVISSQTFQGQTYFYAEVPAPATQALPRTHPKDITIIWDGSDSGKNRDHGKEFALLDQYFKTIKNTRVTLLVARNATETTRVFNISNGNWQSLREALNHTVYDGATNPGIMNIPAKSDLALLFSDGIFNFGNQPFPETKTPLYTISSSAGAHADLLRVLAQKNGGNYLDLLQTNTTKAVDNLQTRTPFLTHLSASGAKELVFASANAENGRYLIAGILTQTNAQVQLTHQRADGTTSTQTVDIHQADTQQAIAAQLWAQFKLSPLLTDPYRHQAQIKRLGKQFNLLSAETSLIVLDNIEDYVLYEIEAPASLQKDYQRLLAQKQQRGLTEKSAHLDQVYQQFSEKEQWWGKAFPKNKPAIVKQKQRERAHLSTDMGASMAAAPAEIDMDSGSNFDERAAPAPMAEPVDALRTRNNEILDKKSTTASSSARSASIQLKKWTPDEPYIKRLQAGKPQDLYAIYLDEKPGYTNSTAFFLDVSDFMFEKGQHELALRVLSNLAEMNLENRHILRILGYRLLQAKQFPLAIPVFERVKQLSPNEPQSLRDLGLAFNQTGQKQQAIDELWTVVSTPWHNRFPEIELIALAEMNAVIATAPKTLDTSKMDKRLLKNLPLSLRTVLSWDADNTDIDLWVTDPDGEKAYYGHRLTYQGGRMSRDFTGGYGPEEFSLKDAKPGKYTIEAQFYGHNQQVVAPATTLMLTLSTNFGKKNQKDESIILRLKGQSEVVTVGTFTVK